MRCSPLIPKFIGYVLALLTVPAVFGQAAVGPEIVISVEDLDEYLPDVAYNSVHDEYFVVWHINSPLQGRWVEGARYDGEGVLLGRYTIAFEDSPPRDNAQPAVAYDPENDRYLVAWTHDVFGDGSDWDIVGRLIPWNGPSSAFQGFNICTFSTQQWNPRVAYAGTQREFLVTWWNENSGSTASFISAERISPSGALLDSITVAYGTEERILPDVAYNQSRNEYLIVYQLMDSGGGNIYAVRMNAGGSILGGGEFGIAAWPDAETSPAVAASAAANQWAVTWQSNTGSDLDVFARRLRVDGSGTVVLEEPIELELDILNQQSPDISAFPGREDFLVTWETQFSNSSGLYGIFARSLDSHNHLGGIVAVRDILQGENINCANPVLAHGPVNSFVVWEHERDATPSYRDIHGRVVFDAFFTDGFESGDTSAWDLATP